MPTLCPAAIALVSNIDKVNSPTRSSESVLPSGRLEDRLKKVSRSAGLSEATRSVSNEMGDEETSGRRSKSMGKKTFERRTLARNEKKRFLAN